MIPIVYPLNLGHLWTIDYGTYGVNGSCHIVISELMVSPYGPLETKLLVFFNCTSPARILPLIESQIED